MKYRNGPCTYGGALDRRNSKHTSQDRSVCTLVQEQHGGQRSQGRGRERSMLGNEAREVAGRSHRAFQAEIRNLDFNLRRQEDTGGF